MEEEKCLYQTVYDTLQERIRCGQIRPGERLPAEKALAEEFGVSRITIQKAMGMLVQDGYIVRRPGRGSFASLDAGKAEQKAGERGADGGEMSRMIGLVMEEFSASFGIEMLKAIEEEAEKKGYHLCIKRSCGDQLRSQGVWLDRRKRFVRSGIRRGRRHCFHRLFAETADFRLELDRFAAMRACFFRCRPGDGFFTAGGALIFLIFQRGIQLHQRSAGGTNKGECAGVEVRRLLSRGGRRNRGNRRGGGNDPRLGSDRRQFDFRFFLSCFRRNRDDLIASRTRGFQPRPIIFGFEFRIAVRAPEMK